MHAKILILFDMSKKIEEKNENVDPRDFYIGLSKKDKGRLLKYLMKRYDYVPCTMSAKLRQNSISRLRKDELENLQKTIKEGVWKS